MDLDHIKLRAYLIAKREFYGALTPIGHRCSNIVELLDNNVGATGDQKVNIDKSLAKQIEDIERLSNSAAPLAEE